MSLLKSKSDLSSILVIAINYAITCYTGLCYNAGLILGLHPANERQCYFVTSLIGWVQA